MINQRFFTFWRKESSLEYRCGNQDPALPRSHNLSWWPEPKVFHLLQGRILLEHHCIVFCIGILFGQIHRDLTIYREDLNRRFFTFCQGKDFFPLNIVALFSDYPKGLCPPCHLSEHHRVYKSERCGLVWEKISHKWPFSGIYLSVYCNLSVYCKWSLLAWNVYGIHTLSVTVLLIRKGILCMCYSGMLRLLWWLLAITSTCCSLNPYAAGN